MNFPFFYYERGVLFYNGYIKNKWKQAQMKRPLQTVYSDDIRGRIQKILDFCEKFLVYNPSTPPRAKRWENILKWDDFLWGDEGIQASLDLVEKEFEIDCDIKDLIEDIEEHGIEFDEAMFRKDFMEDHDAMELDDRPSTSAAARNNLQKMQNSPSTTPKLVLNQSTLEKLSNNKKALIEVNNTTPKPDVIPNTTQKLVVDKSTLENLNNNKKDLIEVNNTTPKPDDIPNTTQKLVVDKSTLENLKNNKKDLIEVNNTIPKPDDIPNSTQKLVVDQSTLENLKNNKKDLIEVNNTTPNPDDRPNTTSKLVVDQSTLEKLRNNKKCLMENTTLKPETDRSSSYTYLKALLDRNSKRNQMKSDATTPSTRKLDISPPTSASTSDSPTRSTPKLDITPSTSAMARYNLKRMQRTENSLSQTKSKSATKDLSAQKIPAYVKRLLSDNIKADLIQIGPNGTTISKRCLEEIVWSKGGPNATRKILSEVFGRDVLASHTLSGKESPAFRGLNKPLKDALDELKVGDIIDVMKNIFPDMSEKEVRSSITTKCADENKMLRLKALRLNKNKKIE